MADLQGTEFTGSQSGIQENHDDRPIPFGGWSLVGKGSPDKRVRFFGVSTRFEQPLHFFFRVDFHGLFLELRCRDALHGIRDLEFLADPLKECGQGHPDVADGFG